ncbi:hypothetical protein P8452_00064 [Trifolium repens]|nr:hypothetical protein P8452_00064 [Trifolium repens]
MEEERKPWLMYFTGKGRMTQTFYNILDPTKSYSKRIPDHLSNSLLWLVTVQNGWYLMENIITKCVSDLFLWNPLNLKKIKLPRLRHNDKSFRHDNCILSITNDEQWSIFILSLNSPSMFYYQLGDKQWTKVCFYDDIVRILTMKGIIPLEEKEYCFDNSVYCNGVLYAEVWTSSSVFIVVIEKLQPNGFTINCTSDVMVQPQPDIICDFEQVISHLIGSNNVLFRIEVFHALDRVDAVFVYKCDCSQRVWEKVESIKDKVFFISNDSVFACHARNPETEGGRVYIALNNCNFVYIYNIEDKSIVTSHKFTNLSNKRSFSRWYMPDTGMTGALRKEHQIEEKKSICDVVYLKEGAGDKAHKEYALPVDMVETIAKYIDDVVDYLHFRASYKFFRLGAPPIQWRSSSMSMSRFDDLSMCPLFVFSMKDKAFTFVHPKHGLEYKNMINFPEGEHWNSYSEICCSKDGWLLLVAVYQGVLVCHIPRPLLNV